jgi:hypothetical protein
MYLFIVEGAGLISLRDTERGELAVIGTGSPKVDEVISSICTTQNGYWNNRYRHWVIHNDARESALTLFRQNAMFVEDKNVFPLHPPRDNTKFSTPQTAN